MSDNTSAAIFDLHQLNTAKDEGVTLSLEASSETYLFTALVFIDFG